MSRSSVSDPVVTPLPRRERDRQQRRTDIFRAAERVFAEKGFHDASIEEIAHAAEYGTGTVYLYFKDKETLYLELIDQKLSELFEHLQRGMGSEKEPLAALRGLIRARMEFFDANRAFFQLYMREPMGVRCTKGARRDGAPTPYDHYIELLTTVVQAGQRRGVIRKGDAGLIAVGLSGLMRQITRHWLQNEKDRPLTESVDLIYDLFLRGAGVER